MDSKDPGGLFAKGASCSGGSFGVCSKSDVIAMVNIKPSFSYRALHTVFKKFGTVLRIRLIYEKDFKSNRCYVTFSSNNEAQSALAAVASLPVAGSGFKAQLIRSSIPRIRGQAR